MKPKLSKCCCFSIRTGTLIVAILGAMRAGFGVLDYSVALATPSFVENAIQAVEDNMKSAYEELRGGRNEKDADYELALGFLEVLRRVLPNIYTAELLRCIFCLAVNAMLIRGVLAKQSFFMLPWLIVEMITLIGLALVVVFGGIALMSIFSAGAGLVVWVVGIPFVALGGYLWAVVQSVYLGINEEEEGPNESNFAFRELGDMASPSLNL